MALSPRVTAAIDKFFPEAERAEVAGLLADYGAAEHEREVERVHLSILKISRRELVRIRDLVKAAKRDYRDVLAWASSQPSRKYVVGLLRNGPNAAPGNRETLQLASLLKWKREGSIVVGGLSFDGDDFRGLYIFTLDSIAKAEELVSVDPAIRSGSLRFEFHTWIAADGLQVGMPKDYLDIDVR